MRKKELSSCALAIANVNTNSKSVSGAIEHCRSDLTRKEKQSEIEFDNRSTRSIDLRWCNKLFSVFFWKKKKEHKRISFSDFRSTLRQYNGQLRKICFKFVISKLLHSPRCWLASNYLISFCFVSFTAYIFLLSFNLDFFIGALKLLLSITTCSTSLSKNTDMLSAMSLSEILHCWTSASVRVTLKVRLRWCR